MARNSSVFGTDCSFSLVLGLFSPAYARYVGVYKHRCCRMLLLRISFRKKTTDLMCASIRYKFIHWVYDKINGFAHCAPTSFLFSIDSKETSISILLGAVPCCGYSALFILFFGLPPYNR